MSKLLKNPLFPFTLAAAVLACGVAGAAEPLLTESIDSEQSREIVRAQDQTQYRNRHQLEKRINGSDSQNRYQEQKRGAEKKQANRHQRAYGAGASSAPRPQGSSAAGSGRRMGAPGNRRGR